MPPLSIEKCQSRGHAAAIAAAEPENLDECAIDRPNISFNSCSLSVPVPSTTGVAADSPTGVKGVDVSSDVTANLAKPSPRFNTACSMEEFGVIRTSVEPPASVISASGLEDSCGPVAATLSEAAEEL